MQGCVFCRIIERQAPAKIVYEDDSVVAFEDLNPQAPVHLLLVPRKHIASLREAKQEDEPLLGHLFTVATQLARERHVDAKGFRTVINNGTWAGQSVFHLHVHVLGGRVFHWPPG
ncbi:MAG: histidine triad nucleotide-binding protein [Terriglobia bacterium]